MYKALEKAETDEICKGGGMGLCFYRKDTYLCCTEVLKQGQGRRRWA